MEWSDTTRLEIIAYCNKITVPRTAKEYLRLCLARIEVLEKANKSFGESFERFSDQLPDVLMGEIERITEAKRLSVQAPDELEAPPTVGGYPSSSRPASDLEAPYEIIEKGGKQPPNPPPSPKANEIPPHHV